MDQVKISSRLNLQIVSPINQGAVVQAVLAIINLLTNQQVQNPIKFINPIVVVQVVVVQAGQVAVNLLTIRPVQSLTKLINLIAVVQADQAATNQPTNQQAVNQKAPIIQKAIPLVLQLKRKKHN